MKLLRGLQSFAEFSAGTVATIGNFDGVHLGHQALLQRLHRLAKAQNLPTVVVLFEPQPGEYFQGRHAPARLASLREKLQVLRELGIDYVYCLKFDKYLANMPADEFAKKIIFSTLNAKYLLIGQDFRFGSNRTGDIFLLQTFAPQYAASVEAYDDFLISKERVSSTNIRKALQDNHLQKVSLWLGRRYTLCGRVIRGEGRGRRWGIPTANIHLQRKKLALNGVFCVEVRRHPDWPAMYGVANLGVRPTVDGCKNTLEVHLLDWDESLYGEMLQVSFLHKLRDEVKFSDFNDLIKQIQNDITEAKTYFSLQNNKLP